MTKQYEFDTVSKNLFWNTLKFYLKLEVNTDNIYRPSFICIYRTHLLLIYYPTIARMQHDILLPKNYQDFPTRTFKKSYQRQCQKQTKYINCNDLKLKVLLQFFLFIYFFPFMQKYYLLFSSYVVHRRQNNRNVYD